MAKVKDLTGMTFGRLTALEQAGKTEHGATLWRCACTCGAETTVVGYSLTQGGTKSCGCSKRMTPAHNRTHNMSGTPLYRVWATMRNRCEDPNVSSYKDYGGRGIEVCDRWHSFENFYADMGDRPSAKHSIERRDNDGDYTPENCFWATKEEQSSNKRNNRWIEAEGETLHLAEWARRLNCNPAAILARIASGMSEAEAVTKSVPDRPNSRLTAQEAVEIRSKYPGLSAQKLADLYGVSKKTVLNVLHRKTFSDV